VGESGYIYARHRLGKPDGPAFPCPPPLPPPQLKTTRLLLAHGANASALTPDGRPLIVFAAELPDDCRVAALLHNQSSAMGALPPPTLCAALFSAAAGNSSACVSLLAGAMGPTRLATCVLHGQTPLHVAVLRCEAAVAGALVRAGADPGRRPDGRGRSPIVTAVVEGRADVLGAMLEAGASPEVFGGGGGRNYTLLSLAAVLGRHEVLGRLLQGGWGVCVCVCVCVCVSVSVCVWLHPFNAGPTC
jgi:hypothetical protein